MQKSMGEGTFTDAGLIDNLAERREQLAQEEQLVLEKAYSSGNAEAIIKANSYRTQQLNHSGIHKGSKSILVDPNMVSSAFGYKAKPFQLSYEVLRAMSRLHVIKAIIETRKDQVSDFAQPQPDKYSTGFVIEKKQSLFEQGEVKNTREDRRNIDWLTEFILNCGVEKNKWHGDTFDMFCRKIVQDSLTLDQQTFEIVPNRRGLPVEFFATDAATYRLADSFLATTSEVNKINGYYPAYVQLYEGRVHTDFYPWELCFGVRNPQTDLATNGYGRSELEDMVQTVTSILNADQYNANYFKVGSNPGGIFRYSGSVSPTVLKDFKEQWLSEVTGVMNMHRIPMINADQIDYIQTHQSNRDMEYSHYQEFLIRICCALYKIDPSEIGFHFNGGISGDSKNLFDGNNASRLEFSKDKGLRPLLRQVQFWINKYIIQRLDDRYQFKFVGLSEKEEQLALDADIKRVTNIETLNEVRNRRGLPDLEYGDQVLNPTYIQYLQAQQQNEMMQQQGDPQANQADGNPYQAYGPGGQPDQAGQQAANPMMKGLHAELEKLLTKGQ